MLKKAYLEITNVCNLSCSFCHGTSRAKGFISVEDFRTAAKKLRTVTEYLYLHLMGEPLLHPQLKELLAICKELGFRTVVTTNGVLLSEKEEILLNAGCIYKYSISLHSYEANAQNGKSAESYVEAVCRFAEKAAAKGSLVSLRLWNGGGKDSLNRQITDRLYAFFPGEHPENRLGVTLTKNVFLEFGDKFDWPDPGAERRNVSFCMGLRDHVGVLCNGTVVPCCLDADGNIPLGNILTDDLENILKSPRASAIYEGFSRREAREELCRRCGYAERFG